MPRISDCINLSDELKQIPIPDLIVMGKSLIGLRGYSHRTIEHYNEKFNDLQRSSVCFGAEKLSEEFVTHYIKEGSQKSPRLTSSSVQRKLNLNLIALAVTGSPVFKYENEADRIGSKSLRESLNAYKQHLKEQNKSKDTIKSYLQTAANFLLYLDRTRVNCLSEVTVNDIQGFIVELGAKWSPRSMRIVPSHLKNYLKFADVQIDAMLFSTIRAPLISRPVRAMSNENVDALWKYIEGDDGDLRAKAMVTIMLVTGMRPVDITGLMLDDINWSNDTIGFVQSKTGEYMNIKLFPVMGSAIVRYITEQRPKGKCQTGVDKQNKKHRKNIKKPPKNIDK